MTDVPPEKCATVCLLDDNPSVLRATSRLVASAGWPVKTFSDPVRFLEYAETCHPQVVVLDILMPVMNGLEVQARLREICPDTRVLILTSKGDEAIRTKAKAAGASAFFVKPVHDEEFLNGIQSAFAQG